VGTCGPTVSIATTGTLADCCRIAVTLMAAS
jgi:hypothetical protein